MSSLLYKEQKKTFSSERERGKKVFFQSVDFQGKKVVKKIFKNVAF